MNLVELIQTKYPGKIEAGLISFKTFDNINILISKWECPDIPKPSDSEIAEMMKDPEINALHQIQKNKQINKPIYEELNAIDLKAIRALMEKDQGRIDQYNIEKEELRKQLLPTTLDQFL